MGFDSHSLVVCLEFDSYHVITKIEELDTVDKFKLNGNTFLVTLHPDKGEWDKIFSVHNSICVSSFC